jgi:hypothetical protein
MKKILLVILTLIGLTSICSPHSHLNWIIFINGKLPESGISNAKISLIDTTGNLLEIPINYLIGDLQLSEKDYNKIISLNPTDSIKLSFTYTKYNGEKSNFEGDLLVSWFKVRYLIIRITTLDKEMKKYYFAYSIPGLSKPFIKSEYIIFDY